MKQSSAWRWIKRHSGMTRQAVEIGQVYKPGTKEPVSGLKDRLEVWAQHFEKLCVKRPDNQDYEVQTDFEPDGKKVRISLADGSSRGARLLISPEPDEYISLITDQEISWAEIASVLRKLRRGKAAGIDGIPGDIYKLVENEPEAASGLSRSILSILNKVYEGGDFPDAWRDCIVVPVFKKGDKLDPDNYRGIALINTLLKVLAKVVADRLQCVCSATGLIRREQAGFMAGEECPAQVACLLEACQRRKAMGLDTVLCFLDLRKAYDLVPHDILLNKLRAKGLGHRMVDFIARMYEHTYMRARADKSVSRRFKYERGVRQGCPTSPMLFNLYINDILDDIEPVSVPGLREGLRGLMFADDTVILAKSREDLVEKLKYIRFWMEDNAMEVNPGKCGVLVVSAETTPWVPVVYNGEEIPVLDKYVYLGVEFNRELDIYEMAKFRLKKGKEALGQLSSSLNNLRVPLEYKTMLVKSVLVPTLHYGTEIFGMAEARMNSLKRVLDNALKCIVKRSNFCRRRAYEEFGVQPLYVSAAVARARGLHKWTNSTTMIRDLIRDTSFKSKKSTWIKEARRWLKLMKIELDQPFEELRRQLVSDRMEKLRHKDRSVVSGWADSLSIKDGCNIRRMQLKHGCSSLGMSMLIRLRTGTFLFTNQMVRLQLLPSRFKNRCVCCDEAVTENVQHLLIECRAFDDLRARYLTPVISRVAPTPGRHEPTMSLVGRLLGGETPAVGGPSYREVLACCEYLSAAVPRRSSLVASRRD